MIKKILCSVMLSSSLLWGMETTNNKLVLIATPRTLSTGFERMIDKRGDYELFDEPAMYAYHIAHQKGTATYSPNAPATYDKVLEDIHTALKDRNVFIKEMHFVAGDYLVNECDSHTDVIFLLRNPHDELISFYKKLFEAVGKNVEWMMYAMKSMSATMDYSLLPQLYKELSEKTQRTPYVIHSEQLAQSPADTVAGMCEYLKIPMIPESLTWKKIENEAEVAALQKKWRNTQNLKSFLLWHRTALESEGFGELPSYDVDEHGEPTFKEIESLELREVFKAKYVENLNHYRKFCDMVEAQKAQAQQ